MENQINAPKELIHPICRAVLGVSSDGLTALEHERGNVVLEQAENLEGDILMIGQPFAWRLNQLSAPHLLLQIIASFLPAHKHRILSARVQAKFEVQEISNEGCVVKEIYPRRVEADDPQRSRTVWVVKRGAEFRLVESPQGSETIFQIQGIELLPKIIGIGQGTNSGIWDYYGIRGGPVEGSKVSYLIIRLPEQASYLAVSFDVSAIIETPFGIFPFTVKRVITGTSEFKVDLSKLISADHDPLPFAPEQTPSSPGSKKVFVSYSHKDTQWLKRLQVHLKPLDRAGLVDLWDDTRIKPGTKWNDEIKRALDSARVAVLLISADFLASDFIAENELPALLASAEEKGTIILPVIVSPSLFVQTVSLSQFQAVNDPSNPLIKMNEGEREEIYSMIASLIKRVLE